MNEEHPWRDKSWLVKEYVKKEKTTTEISQERGCSPSVIRKWLNKFNIETRGPNREPADERLSDREWLWNQYVERGRIMADIADDCGCNRTTVGKWLDRHNIEKRKTGPKVCDERLTDEDWLHDQYVQQGKTTRQIANEFGFSQGTVSRWLRRHNIDTRSKEPDIPDERLADEEWLRKEYSEKEKTIREIANECGCVNSTVLAWISKHNIKTRDMKPRSGEDHPAWEGGIPQYGPGWNPKKRRAVRERDGRACCDPNCSVTQEEHIQEYGEKLHVHHLRKARDVDDPEERNSKNNLITLCRSCHLRWERISKTGLVPQIVSD